MSEQPIINTSRLSLMLVDDEVEVLNALNKTLSKDYNVVMFESPAEALEHLNKHKVDFVVSDLSMPEMDGVEFLTKVKEINPEALRFLLSEREEIEMEFTRIASETRVFAFLAKPINRNEIRFMLRRGEDFNKLRKEKAKITEDLKDKNSFVVQLNNELGIKYDKGQAHHESSALELRKMLQNQKRVYKDLVEMLSLIIAHRTGSESSHIERIAHQCRTVANQIGLEKSECNRIYVAALIHELGILTLKDEVFVGKSIRELSQSEEFLKHPEVGADILSKIKRLAALSDIVLHQNENLDGSGTPNRLAGIDIPLGSRIVRVVRDYDYMVAGNQNPEKISPHSAKKWLADKSKKLYDQKVVRAFLEVLKSRPEDDSYGGSYCVGIEELKIDDVVKKDFTLINGNVMIKEGQVITQQIIARLHEYEKKTQIKVTLFV